MDTKDPFITLSSGHNGGSRSGAPTQHDWERHRDTISRLYFDENETVKSVRATMASQYGFYATERMFKGRLRSWGVRKNLSTKDMIRSIKITREREQLGKRTRVRIRGREVDSITMRKFRNRKRQTDQEIIKATSTRSTTPSDFSVFTPQLSPADIDTLANGEGLDFRFADDSIGPPNPTIFNVSPTPVLGGIPDFDFDGLDMDASIAMIASAAAPRLDSDVLWNTFGDTPLFNGLPEPQTRLWDEVLTGMKSYYDFYFQSPSWFPYSLRTVNYEGDEFQTFVKNDFTDTLEVNRAIFNLHDPGALVTLYEVACLLLQRGDAEAGRRFTEEATNLLGHIMQDEHPQFLGCLLLVIGILQAKEKGDLVDELLAFAHSKACTIHDQSHPMIHLISCWARASAQQSFRAVDALKWAIPQFENAIGPQHETTLRIKEIYAYGLFQQDKFEEALSELRQLQLIYQNLAGDDHVNSRHVTFEIAQIYFTQGKFNEAEETFREVYRLSEQRHGRDPPVMINLECLRMLAAVYRRQEKLHEVIPALCKALPVGLKLLGKEHPTVVLIWHDLKKMLK